MVAEPGTSPAASPAASPPPTSFPGFTVMGGRPVPGSSYGPVYGGRGKGNDQGESQGSRGRSPRRNVRSRIEQPGAPAGITASTPNMSENQAIKMETTLQKMYRVFDIDKNGILDVQEVAAAMVILCKGSMASKVKFGI